MDGEHQSARNSRDTWLGRLIDAIDQFTPVLTVIALLMVMTAAVYTFQGQARINQVVDCFSDYTSAYTSASANRIQATEDLEAKAAANDTAFVAWVQGVIDLFNREDPEGVALRKATLVLLDTSRDVQTARVDLQDTREDNPFPAPCNVER